MFSGVRSRHKTLNPICTKLPSLFVLKRHQQTEMLLSKVRGILMNIKEGNMSNRTKLDESKNTPEDKRRYAVVLAACFLLITAFVVAQITHPNGLTPKEQAEKIALSYVKALLRCDAKAANALRAEPLPPEATKTCRDETIITSGKTVKTKDITVTVYKSDYSKKQTSSGTSEKVIVYPDAKYKQEDIGANINPITLERRSAKNSTWKVVK